MDIATTTIIAYYGAVTPLTPEARQPPPESPASPSAVPERDVSRVVARRVEAVLGEGVRLRPSFAGLQGHVRLQQVFEPLPPSVNILSISRTSASTELHARLIKIVEEHEKKEFAASLAE